MHTRILEESLVHINNTWLLMVDMVEADVLIARGLP